MSSDVEIANLALAHCDAEGSIDSLDASLGEEERLCVKFLNPLRRDLLVKHEWGFAGRQVALALSTFEPVDPRWEYAYQYPTSCLKFRKVINPADPDAKIQYTLFRDPTEGRLIFTNQEDALGEFTIDVTDAAEYSPDFVMCLSWYLAAHIALPLTGKSSIRDHALGMYQRLAGPSAMAADANEQEDQRTAEASWIQAR